MLNWLSTAEIMGLVSVKVRLVLVLLSYGLGEVVHLPPVLLVCQCVSCFLLCSMLGP